MELSHPTYQRTAPFRRRPTGESDARRLPTPWSSSPRRATPRWRDGPPGRERELHLRVIRPRRMMSDREGGAKGGGQTPPQTSSSTPRLRVDLLSAARLCAHRNRSRSIGRGTSSYLNCFVPGNSSPP